MMLNIVAAEHSIISMKLSNDKIIVNGVEYYTDSVYFKFVLKLYFLAIFISAIGWFVVQKITDVSSCDVNEAIIYLWPYNVWLIDSLRGSAFSHASQCEFFTARAILSACMIVWLIFSILYKIKSRNNLCFPKFILYIPAFCIMFFVISCIGFQDNYIKFSLSLHQSMSLAIIKSFFYINIFYFSLFLNVFNSVAFFIGKRMPWSAKVVLRRG